MRIKLLFVASLFFLFSIKEVLASEGEAQLRSLINHPNRCLASSHTNAKNTYTILVSCRDLNYTPTAQAIAYIMWASPSNGNPVKLGILSYGKAQFTSVTPFNSLFVTVETDQSVRQPQGQVIMRGDVRSYAYLDQPAEPAPTVDIVVPTAEPVSDVAIEPIATDRSNILRRGGVVVSIVVLGLLVGFIFVITRPRR